METVLCGCTRRYTQTNAFKSKRWLKKSAQRTNHTQMKKSTPTHTHTPTPLSIQSSLKTNPTNKCVNLCVPSSPTRPPTPPPPRENDASFSLSLCLSLALSLTVSVNGVHVCVRVCVWCVQQRRSFFLLSFNSSNSENK